ncbi:MAG: hypothetical protein HN353_09610 [Bdellovibrionales bacterium]|nr:hypothetical protein [Bdellovibrionales bacterium]MBT3525758.1 hypothetical protein [Bdellovibrionales bacterium]MBT7670129.1 hypothetical protein [Bdellovibrionales bacterium]
MKTALILSALLLTGQALATISSIKCTMKSQCLEYTDLCISSFMLHYSGEEQADVEITSIVDGIERTTYYGRGIYYREENILQVDLDDLDTWITLEEDGDGHFNGRMIFEEDFLFEQLQCEDSVPSPFSLANIVIIPGESDRILPFDKHGKRLAKEIINSKFVNIPRGDHVAIFTHRQTIQRAVNTFFDSL